MPRRNPHASAIATRRLALGLTQWRLAALANISPAVLQRHELGRIPLTEDRLAAVEAVLAQYERLAHRAQRAAEKHALLALGSGVRP